MAEEKLNMLAEVPAISTKAWKEKIVADLKGADFDKKLVWRTTEGFNVQPFYRQDNRICTRSIPLRAWYQNQQRVGSSPKHLRLQECSQSER